MNPTGPIARRFPLVARARPACVPLQTRVHGLRDLADAAARDHDPVRASTVYNQAALLASDLGLPDLAWQWCHQHAAAYLRALPLGAKDARRGLEPLVNLARLRIRAGEGTEAFQLLDRLYTAITDRSDTTIGTLTVPAASLTASVGDHHQLRQWLWSVHISDGARALAGAGCWEAAEAHLRRNNGIGQRMLDGRQVAVIARATSSEPDQALRLLRDTTPVEPWETAVTACLTVLCRRAAGRCVDTEIDELVNAYLQVEQVPGLAVFTTRLGLSVIDAANATANIDRHAIAARVIDQTIRLGDGYAARDLLAHPNCAALLTHRQHRCLTELVDACALDAGAIPSHLHPELLSAVRTSDAVLTDVFGPRGCAHRPGPAD